MRKLPLIALAFSLILPVTSEAAPIAVNCPDNLNPDDRQFTVTTDPTGATCIAYGNDANELNANASDVMVLAGWTVIDKDDSASADNWFNITGLGATSGSFTIDPAAWSAWDQLAIGFVVGAGQIDPKWAVFLLPDGETSGLWANVPPTGGALSHAVLYGMGEPDDPDVPVPEPATLLLLGSGLTLAVRNRRAKR